MASRMREAGIEGFMPAWLGWIIGRTYARIEESDLIYASDAAYEEVRTLSPGKVKLFPMTLEKSESVLRELV